MGIEIRELVDADAGVRRAFLEVAAQIYAGDPCWVRPLDMDIVDRFNRRKNPFFQHGEATAWVAWQGGRPVGRVSASVDHEHLRLHRDGAGFFGFFDTIDDAEVAGALLERAQSWLAARDLERMRGPLSLCINEESGCLVDGFDSSPMFMMPHHLPYQAGLIEGAGLRKLKDLYAWKYEIGRVPPRAERGHDEIARLPEVSARPIRKKTLEEDMRVVMDIFNDAWSDNWGFVPMTEQEVVKTAQDVKLIAIEDITRLVFIDGEPAAVALGLPNLNECIQDLNGSLFPFGFVKLLWRLRVRGPKSGRLILLGIRKKYRQIRRYAGLSAYLYVALNRSSQLLGMTRAELSWTLEDNAAVNVGIKMMGGSIYKTYRIFEKAIGAKAP
ncbi:MAG: hypothetical protein HY744_15075 [Deltaproteobacteria bacterium]|nr:hypothetical protein [Deltaproteobacteria bacterium]